jgi:hypothetical protein
MNIEEVKRMALQELAQDELRKAIDQYKKKLRETKWYHKIFPWRIVIIKKEHV